MDEVQHTGTYKTENYETVTTANGEILAFREVNNEIDSVMTKEEAITILCAIDVPEGNNAFIDKKAHQAIQMAIDALSIGHVNNSSEHFRDTTKKVSEDLEEAVNERWDELQTNFREINEAFEAGKKEQREQMLKEAVEGKVFMSSAPGHNQMVMADVDLPTNTKVRVIVLPKNERL